MSTHNSVAAHSADDERELRQRKHFPQFTADDFKAAFRLLPGGVALITADAGEGPVALTATSVSSVSADPALLMFSISVRSSSAPTIARAETVVVHLLNAANIELAHLGATSGIDRFADTSRWTRLTTGEPVFAEATWLRARIINSMDAGGSTVFVGQAIQSNVLADSFDELAAGEKLAYVNRQWHRLGEHSHMK